jgi:cytochrome c-type biogenesis protein CcmE
VAVTPGPVDTDDAGPESADAAPMPVPVAGVRPRSRLGSRRRQVIAFAVIVIALGVLVFRGLGNATVYFKTVDEAVAARAQLGSQRFRIEGTVQNDVHPVGGGVAFTIANNGVSVAVLNTNSPPQLFKPGIPVVLEGHFVADGSFASDLIMVKHTASYVAQHPDRVTTVPTPTTLP